MNRRLFTTALSSLFLTGAVTFAQTAPSTSPASPATRWTIDKNHTQADFKIRHMGVSNVHGSLSGVTGTVVWDEKNLGRSSVEATIDATTISTNNGMRDKDLKSATFFNVEKFPSLTFKSTSVTRTNGKLQVNGNLTLAGVTRSITLDGDGPTAPQKGMDGKQVIGLSASGVVKRSDFNFGSKYGAPILGDDVQFTIDVEADQ